MGVFSPVRGMVDSSDVSVTINQDTLDGILAVAPQLNDCMLQRLFNASSDMQKTAVKPAPAQIIPQKTPEVKSISKEQTAEEIALAAASSIKDAGGTKGTNTTNKAYTSFTFDNNPLGHKIV